jgi:DNA-binding transcriptional regulator YhcF (GntR family)
VKIDPNDPRPPFRQAADDLRRRIGKGEFGTGERLPSVRDLAAEYGVAPQTMQNALKELRRDELVVAQQGRAFFVRDPSRPAGGGTDSERLAAAETALRELQERVAAVEADNAELRALVLDLRDHQAQPKSRASRPRTASKRPAGD